MEKRSGIMKGILTVTEKIYLTPNYIRIRLRGTDLENFEVARVGDNNKIVLPNDKGIIVFPEFGGSNSSNDLKTVIRTYTMRDFNKDLMTVDFVCHGDEGPASRWATSAVEGDKLGVLMKEKSKPLYQKASHYYLTGDHTALPVISVILETLPVDVKGKAVIEVFSKQDVLNLKKPENLEIEWLFNSTPGKDSKLAQKLRDFNVDKNRSIFVYAAAESSIIKEIQYILRTEKELDREKWQSYSYWKLGHAEDESAQERRESTR